MTRWFAHLFVTGLALCFAVAAGANEIFPNVHDEPITVQVLSGIDGKPVPFVHLLVIGGYDPQDMRQQLWQQETLTNAAGNARLSSGLANLPFVQVWVKKAPLCQHKPRTASFSVERVRREGLSTPNQCGLATVEEIAGVFTVFVKHRGNPNTSQTSLKISSGQGAAAIPVSVETAVHAPVLAPAPVAARIPTPDAPPAAQLLPLPAKASSPAAAPKPADGPASIPPPAQAAAAPLPASPPLAPPAPAPTAAPLTASAQAPAPAKETVAVAPTNAQVAQGAAPVKGNAQPTPAPPESPKLTHVSAAPSRPASEICCRRAFAPGWKASQGKRA